jgi:hypothetical protein
LKDRWKGSIETFLGIMVDRFPNMMMLVGPHTALGNIPRSIEYNVEWVAGLLGYMQQHKLSFAEPTPGAVEEWTANVRKHAEGLLSNEIDSWMTGVNRNIDGKTTRIVARYSGSAPAYRAWCDRVAVANYEGVDFA